MVGVETFSIKMKKKKTINNLFFYLYLNSDWLMFPFAY